jgi:hypothetical protein
VLAARRRGNPGQRLDYRTRRSNSAYRIPAGQPVDLRQVDVNGLESALDSLRSEQPTLAMNPHMGGRL